MLKHLMDPVSTFAEFMDVYEHEAVVGERSLELRRKLLFMLLTL